MAKSKKKRNKVYTGADARMSRPQKIRISAENRSGSQQWLYERKHLRRPLLIGVFFLIVLAMIVLGIASLFGVYA